MANKKKIKTLRDIPLNLSAAQQAALMRLHLYLIGRTHKMLSALADRFRLILGKHAEDGGLSDMGYFLAQREMLTAWQTFFREWAALFQAARVQAGSIPFGMLAVQHERVSTFLLAEKNESRVLVEREDIETEGGGDDAPDLNAVFVPQLQTVIDAANRRLYADGIPLSQRIWNLDQNSWSGIQQILAQGVSEGESAWNLAKLLEQYLGAGQECPRWTSTRLYGLTKQDIADGNRTGLYSGEECAGQGVAYNALRLARNELQIIHHLATDTLFSRMPWITHEQINLSPSHPAIGCACEDIVGGGENADGVYPKGEVQLPIHVQCLCYKTAVLMDDDEFVRRARGWLYGTEPWPAMDDYASWLGIMPLDVFTVSLMVGVATSLAVWLWGDENDLDQAVQMALPI